MTRDAAPDHRTELLEREDAIEAVASTCRQAAEGHGSALFVVGEPGVGKTTVLAAARRLATGFALGAAGCSEVESALPFGLLSRLFDPLGSPAVLAGAGPDASADARAGRYLKLVEWLSDSAPVPLLLCVDDLHWADRDSADMLMLLCRRLLTLPVVLMATTRPWPSDAVEKARLATSEGLATTIDLQPLSEGASRVLLGRGVEREMPEAVVARTVEMCAGNPLLLGEAAAGWRRGEDVVGEATEVLATRIFLPRFAGVDTQALRVARAASVLGPRFEPSVAAELAGCDEHDAGRAMEALCQAGLVRDAVDAGAEFVHALFQKALYEDMPALVRQGVHARAYRLLLARRAPVAEAAPHALAAQLQGDAEVVDALYRAGREAMAKGASASAAEHFANALTLAGAHPPVAVQLELSEAAMAAGDVLTADEVLTRALARDDLRDAERVDVLRSKARVALLTSGMDETRRLADEASAVAAGFDPVLSCDILLDSTFTGWLFEGPRRARVTTRRVLDTIEDAAITDERLLLAARTADANLAYMLGDPSGLADMASLALANLHDAPRSPWSWDVRFGYVNLAKLAERFDDDAIGYAALASAARRDGATLTYQTYAVNHADTLWRLGRLHEAYGLLHEAAELIALIPALAPFASVGLAHVCHERGLEEESAAWTAQLHQLLGVIGESAYLRLWLLTIGCRLAMRRGATDEALDAARRAWHLAEDSGILEPCIVPWHSTALEALAVAGDLDGAEELAERLGQLCAALPCQAPRAVSLAGRATAAWRRGRFEEAEALYDAALACNASVPMPLAEAETLLAKGRFLRHCGRPAEARTVLQRALDVLEPTGAVRLQTMVGEELAAAGGRRRRRQSTELTDQERRVAALAAEGLTNKEIAQHLFLSPKTVDHHLSRLYAKLGISSRRDLMRRRGELEP